MPIWRRGGLPPGAAHPPAATGRCSSGGSSGTVERSTRCWRDLRPFVARPPLLRRHGSTTRSGSSGVAKARQAAGEGEPCAFEQLFLPWSTRPTRGFGRRSTRGSPTFERSRAHVLRLACFGSCPSCPRRRSTSVSPRRAMPAATPYEHFVADMQAGGWRRLFEDKPVLLRLLATRAAMDRDLARNGVASRCRSCGDPPRYPCVRQRRPRCRIEGNLSDPHNNGRSVRIVASRTARGSSTSRRICGSMPPGTAWSNA